MIFHELPREQDKKPRFIFVGRLTREKGFDRVIAVAKLFLDHPEYGSLDICGTGEQLSILRENLSKYPGYRDIPSGGTFAANPSVIYHGLVKGEYVRGLLSESHYMLMPSRFLETFGLSALESLTEGVPVIGFSKGGLRQFLLSEHEIKESQDDRNNNRIFFESVFSLAKEFSCENWHRQSLTVQDIAAKYSRKSWFEQFSKNIQNRGILRGGMVGKRILMVTDYSENIGGIESCISSTETELEKQGYRVQKITSQGGKKKVFRFLGLIGACCNILFYFRLKNTISSFSPDIIWLHSVNRSIGPIGLASLQSYKGMLLATYHDLGFTAPFPSRIEREMDVPEFTLQEFCSIQRKMGYFLQFPLIIKYLLLLRVKPIFERVDIHFVPSEFLVKYVAYQYGHPERIEVLPHFNPHSDN